MGQVIYQRSKPAAKSAQAQRVKMLERPPAADLPPFRLTKRDTEIVKAIYQYKALTTHQVEALLFPADDPLAVYGKRTKCQERLRKLYQYGYVWRDEIPTKRSEGMKPFVYWLDEKGAQLLLDLLAMDPEEIEWDPDDRNVSAQGFTHLMATNDTWVAIQAAARITGLQIKRWIDDRTLQREHNKAGERVTIKGARGKQVEISVVPDGYFHLWTDKHHLHHFIEIDRGTTTVRSRTQKNWAKKTYERKVKGYLAYKESGQFERRYGAKNFRMLTVTTSQRRLDGLKEITEQVGGKNMFWFTTFEQVTPDAIFSQAIWQVAGRDGFFKLVR